MHNSLLSRQSSGHSWQTLEKSRSVQVYLLAKKEIARDNHNRQGVIHSFFKPVVERATKSSATPDFDATKAAGYTNEEIRRTFRRDVENAGRVVHSSLQDFFSTLRNRYKGRHPNLVRAVQQGVGAAIGATVPRGWFTTVATAVGCSSSIVCNGHARWHQWLDGGTGDLIDLRGAERGCAWLVRVFWPSMWGVTSTPPCPLSLPEPAPLAAS